MIAAHTYTNWITCNKSLLFEQLGVSQNFTYFNPTDIGKPLVQSEQKFNSVVQHCVNTFIVFLVLDFAIIYQEILL